MQLPAPEPVRNRESVVPMINVVFLLLIFFLMTSQIAPPDPVEVTPPLSEAGAPVDQGDRLFLSADGSLRYGGLSGAAALEALAARGPQAAPVILSADAEVPAETVAQLLRQLAALGIGQVSLSVRPQ
ncbi:MAG: ExbD/TolR family protein [Pseudodonghicola sp.]